MIDEKKISFAKRALKRIFALPINRSTYREMHSAFQNILEGNVEQANTLLEVLLIGDVNSEKAKNFPKNELQSLIEEFSTLVWTAKDVFERGDFISLVTSDMISTPNQQVFSNRMKRIDGKEFHFITDVESTLQLLSHFAARIHELEKNPAAKQFLNSRQNELISVKKKLETILTSHS